MTLSLAFHDAKAMVSFSLLGLQARSLAFNPLDVHGPSHKYIMCITARQFFTNYSTVFLVFEFWRLRQTFSCSYFSGAFPVFRFFSSCCCAYRLSPVSADLVRFPKSSHISCRLGFVSFPSSRRFCANEHLPPVCFFFFATNAPRLLPFRSLIVLSIFCSTGFSRRFPRFHLCLFGLVQWLLRVSEHLFFFQFCPFVQVPLDFEQACQFF